MRTLSLRQRAIHPTHLLLGGLILATCFVTPIAMAQETNIVYTEPPAPEHLAQQLFGPRYRSAATAEQMFGMLIQFEFDSTKIKPQSLPLLDAVGEMMTLPEATNRSIVVEGHTDSVGTSQYNDSLSLRRARAVIDYLSTTFDLTKSRFSAAGKGERQPHDTTNPSAPINRRAVFRATQKIRLK